MVWGNLFITSSQDRRHGGGHSGAVLPEMIACAPLNEKCAPPTQARLVPGRNEQAWCYWSAIRGQNNGYHPRIRGQELFSVDFAINADCLCSLT